ncbi:MAG TPA: hypothetical protein VFT31_14210 [Kribbella sp.]|nr:hypothetical protein [Kribbella sp.]
MSTEQDWSDYARALRQVAYARADAQQAQDRLTANRSRAEATAMAEAEAMAERGRKLEERLDALAEKATAGMAKAGVPVTGKRAPIALPKVRGIADIEVAAAQLANQLGDAVERLEQVRAKARAERERRRRRTIGAGLVVVAFALVWPANGSVLAGAEAAVLVLLTLLTTPRFSGSLLVAWGAAVVVGVVMVAGLPWWLAILVPVIVAGAGIVAPKKRN